LIKINLNDLGYWSENMTLNLESFPKHIQEIVKDLNNWYYLFHPPVLRCKWCYKEVETPIIFWYGPNGEYMISFHAECCFPQLKPLNIPNSDFDDYSYENYIVK
jgi:hypothetical protein